MLCERALILRDCKICVDKPVMKFKLIFSQYCLGHAMHTGYTLQRFVSFPLFFFLDSNFETTRGESDSSSEDLQVDQRCPEADSTRYGVLC